MGSSENAQRNDLFFLVETKCPETVRVKIARLETLYGNSQRMETEEGVGMVELRAKEDYSCFFGAVKVASSAVEQDS